MSYVLTPAQRAATDAYYLCQAAVKCAPVGHPYTTAAAARDAVWQVCVVLGCTTDSPTPVAQPVPATVPFVDCVDRDVPFAEGTEAPTADARYASAKQKEEIIRLLNNPVITRAEKTKMLLNINKFDDARAARAIENLRNATKRREGEQRVAA